MDHRTEMSQGLQAIRVAHAAFRQTKGYDQRVALAVLKTETLEPLVILPSTSDMAARLRAEADEIHPQGVAQRARYGRWWVSVLETGIGSSSIEIAVYAAHAAGGKILVRADFCGSLREGIGVGDVFVAEGAYAALELPPYHRYGEASRADPDLTKWLCILLDNSEGPAPASVHIGTMCTTGVFFAQNMEMLDEWATHADCVDMESATLFAITESLQMKAAAVHVVSDAKREGVDTFNLSPSGVARLNRGVTALCRKLAVGWANLDSSEIAKLLS